MAGEARSRIRNQKRKLRRTLNRRSLGAELEATVVAAGFVGFEITWRKDVFSDVPQAGSAEKFGTLGINFRALGRRPMRRSGARLWRHY
jgi:hypothetical protein